MHGLHQARQALAFDFKGPKLPFLLLFWVGEGGHPPVGLSIVVSGFQGCYQMTLRQRW